MATFALVLLCPMGVYAAKTILKQVHVIEDEMKQVLDAVLIE